MSLVGKRSQGHGWEGSRRIRKRDDQQQEEELGWEVTGDVIHDQRHQCGEREDIGWASSQRIQQLCPSRSVIRESNRCSATLEYLGIQAGPGLGAKGWDSP